MSSPGQALGYIAGGAIGLFFGAPMLGAAIGGAIGGMIDPPKGPNITGPRLDDLSLQTSTYGAALGRAYGTVPVVGNIFWLEGDQLKEVTTTEEQGGKGGPSQTSTTYSYFATFGVGLLHVTDPNQTVALRRLWIGTDLFYDAGSDNLESIIASNSQSSGFTFYNGADDQLPNHRMQADKGAANVSAYPGLCYIVFEDLALEKYGNTLQLAQVKAELVVGSVEITVTEDTTPVVHNDPYESNPLYYRYVSSVLIGTNAVETALVRLFDNITYSFPQGVNVWRNELGIDNRCSSFADSNSMSGHDGSFLPLHQSDRSVVYAVKYYHPTNPVGWLEIFEVGSLEPKVGNEYPTRFSMGIGVVHGSAMYCCSERTNSPILLYSGTEHVATSSQIYNISTLGYSENYLWAIDASFSSSVNCRVHKISRGSLGVVAWMDFSADGRWPVISVAADDACYVCAGNELWRTDGVTATNLGVWFTGINMGPGELGWFKVFSESPRYAVFTKETNDGDDQVTTWIIHDVVPAEHAYLSTIIESESALAGLSSSDIDTSLLGTLSVRGIRVAGKATPRSVIETLQPVHPFDVTQAGYKVKFVPRGLSSVASIDESEICAQDSGGTILPVSREMDSQLPARVSIKYLDVDREYDLGEQMAERPCHSENERTLDLPISMSGSEAAWSADVIMQKDWIERSSYGPFNLPPSYRHLEPADVITVSHRGQSHKLRLTRIEYQPDGVLACSGVRTSAQAFTSTAQAADPLVLGQSLVPLYGSTTGIILDIPTILESQNTAGVVVGMYGLSSGWPGATFFRSDDSGTTWNATVSVNNKLRVFYAGAAMSTGTPYSVDVGSRLTVTPRNVDHALYSLSNAEFFSGKNIAAYGIDGRWEIINFKTVIDNGDGTFTLANFRRGLYGTEAYMAAHADGDQLVMLGSAVGFASLPISSLGVTKQWKAVTQGVAISSAPTISHYYAGVNLRPLSPVKLNGARHWSTFDWSLGWSPRSRTPNELFSGFAVPLADTLTWDVEIWNSGYTTLKRTFSGLASPTATYTSAQQIADFADNQVTLYLDIYPVSSTYGRGAKLRTSIDRYVFPDPYRLSVTALLHMNDTGLTDQIGSTVTLVGNTARSATQSKFGGYSAFFDGTGDYLQLAASSKFDFGTGDFTVEAWVYIAANSAQDAWPERTAMIFAVGTGTGAYQFTFAIQGSSTTTGTGLNVSAGAGIYTSSATISQGAWHHCAVCRASGYVYLLLDGARIATHTAFIGVAMGSSVNPAYIGGRPYTLNYNQYLNGYIDEVRVTKGVARYAASTYTVPTAEFPNP